MIYDGYRGYLSGDLSQPNDTVLAMTKGPIQHKNWYSTTIDPAYSISISNGATGTVALQGTNDVSLQSAKDGDRRMIEADMLPNQDATWADIAPATSTSVTGTFSTEYEFLRLVIVDSGDGFVTQAWVRWT